MSIRGIRSLRTFQRSDNFWQDALFSYGFLATSLCTAFQEVRSHFPGVPSAETKAARAGALITGEFAASGLASYEPSRCSTVKPVAAKSETNSQGK